MAVDSRGAKGEPIFLNTGAPATGADLTLLGAEIYQRGTRPVVTEAERDALVTAGIAYDGLAVFNTTAGHEEIYLSGAWKHGPGGVLWSGTPTTLASGIVSLSEPVSAQWSGIVLVWTLTSGETATSLEFIPKFQVAAAPGADYRFYMGSGASGGGGVLANVRKIIFITDTQITGNAGNATAPADTYVLRRVIGV